MDLQHVIITHLNLQNDWQQKKLVVGFSGGLDSTVLLSVLASVRDKFPELNLSAIHVNHGLMQNCNEWQKHCENYCAAIQVPFKAVTCDSITKTGKGIENAAREQRFKVFQQLLTEGDLLLLGHHANDQTETVIFRLLRGTGIVGLAGIKSPQIINNITVVRPLLYIEKFNLNKYAIENQLNWIEDKSNSDEQYDRNFIRKNIIPVLQSRWPDIHQKLHKNSILLQQQSLLLDQLAVEDSKQLLSQMGFLKLDEVPKLNQSRVLNFLSWWFRENSGYSLSSTRLNLIYHELNNYRKDANFKHVCQDHVLLQSSNRAFLISNVFFEERSDDRAINSLLPDTWSKTITVNISPFVSISLSFQSSVDFENFKNLNLSINSGIKNGKIKLFDKAHSSEIRKLFQQKNIPAWLKPHWPILTKNKDLVSIPDFGHLQEYAKKLNGVTVDCLFCFGDDRHFKI